MMDAVHALEKIALSFLRACDRATLPVSLVSMTRPEQALRSDSGRNADGEACQTANFEQHLWRASGWPV
jgi:hypothetical protein